VVGILKEGEILGELAYIAKIPRTASAVAVGRTVIGIIDRNFFDQEFNKLSGDFQKMIKMVAVRLKIATETICQAKLKGS
jgi:CRP-like cAMP-binding protein